MNQGTFPRPVDIGGKLVAWPESSIDAWISAKLEAADRKAAECDRETEAA
jgi:predicted DNA-binding transcriptional regulator AlpA